MKNETILFNRRLLTSEDVAIEFFTSRGWYLNSYGGSNGITFHKVGKKAVTIYRRAGVWEAGR